MQMAKLAVEPIQQNFSLKDRVYDALHAAIMAMDLYGGQEELRLDERQLAQDLGVSRTPIREAITRLEQEGFLRVVQRRGVFVIRKTKKEILEMIVAWAALESMAARLITTHASDEDIATLRHQFSESTDPHHLTSMDEYSEKNIRFHQQILKIADNALIIHMSENLFAHMRSIRHLALGQNNRMNRSVKDHTEIIEALEKRDTDLAEKLVRRHTLDLAAHVEQHVDFLD